jgi:hypothetical protein
MTRRPDTIIDLQVEIDHGQLYIYSVAPWAENPDNDAVLRALDDARRSGRWVGLADGLIDLVVPFGKSFDAPMRVEVWSAEPPSDDTDWDHVVDLDFDVHDGRLVFEPSGGFAPIPCDQPLPSGSFRVRLSGRGYTAATGGAEGMDQYRIALWPRNEDTPPTVRRIWPGWAQVT